MAADSYERERTALLFIDPYNDFLSEGGKFWPMVEGVAKEVGLLDNLRAVVAAVRKAGIPVFIVPHRRGGPATTKAGIIPTPIRSRPARRRPSRRAGGAGSGTPISRRKRGISSPKNIGARADSPTPTSISNSNSGGLRR